MAQATVVEIKPLKLETLSVTLVGTAPFVQARFSDKAQKAMKAKHIAGSTAKKGGKKEARDFEADFLGAFHRSPEGWVGVPAAAFRNACIDVCRMVNFKMTHAKMSIFTVADGLDAIDGIPLVRLVAGDPEVLEMATRNATGVADIRVRPMWREWSVNLTMQFDGDQFTHSDVANLLERAGTQIGIGEGRPYSKSSNGLGYGTFTLARG